MYLNVFYSELLVKNNLEYLMVELSVNSTKVSHNAISNHRFIIVYFGILFSYHN